MYTLCKLVPFFHHCLYPLSSQRTIRKPVRKSSDWIPFQPWEVGREDISKLSQSSLNTAFTVQPIFPLTWIWPLNYFLDTGRTHQPSIKDDPKLWKISQRFSKFKMSTFGSALSGHQAAFGSVDKGGVLKPFLSPASYRDKKQFPLKSPFQSRIITAGQGFGPTLCEVCLYLGLSDWHFIGNQQTMAIVETPDCFNIRKMLKVIFFLKLQSLYASAKSNIL